MRVLFISQAIAQNELDQIVAALPEKSQMVFLTGSPVNHPSVEIVKTATHDSESLKSRLACWIKYRRDVRAWASCHKGEKFDLIYGISNPPINARLGLWLKKKFHAPFVYMNWDLYPQIIEGTIENPIVKMVCKAWHADNSHNYPRIDQMITIGRIMADSINAPLKKKIDIKIVPIACNTKWMVPLPKEKNPFISENGLQGKFIVLYSGKLGFGHNIQCFLKAAEYLVDKQDIVFLFIGKGPRCAEVEEAIAHGAKNVRLLPYQPEEVVPFSMACGDVGIVSQEKKIAHLFLPSKTYTMMSCGMPIVGLCTGNDDLKFLIDDSHAGFEITENDPRKVADCIKHLYLDTLLREQYSLKAREYVVAHFSEEAVIQQYSTVFQTVLAKGRN